MAVETTSTIVLIIKPLPQFVLLEFVSSCETDNDNSKYFSWYMCFIILRHVCDKVKRSSQKVS